jgi:pimeloyl-ACP methyl ester carboxylesterase
MCPVSKPAREAAIRGKLKVAGGEVAYETSGAGSPVLFVHSVIADRRMWDRELSVFSKDHQAIRFDLRGFGGSTPTSGAFSNVEDVRSLLAHLHLPRAYLVGSSMGGGIAVDFALEHPEMVSGLLLAAPGLSGGLSPPFTPEEQAAFEYDDKKSQEIAQAWSKGDKTGAFELLRQLWCSALEGPSLELFHRMVVENAPEVFDNRTMQHATSAPPAAARLPALKAPTTVLIGDRDNPSSVPFARRVASSVVGSRLVTIPGADHLINLSRPAAFEAALTAALQNVG